MILQMKKVTVFALRRYRDDILTELQKRSVMMIEQSDGSAPDCRLEEAQRKVAEAGEAIKFLTPYSTEKTGLLVSLPEVLPDEIAAPPEDGAAAEARAIKDELASIAASVSSHTALIKQAQPWENCPLTPAELEGSESASVLTGYIPLAALADFQQQIEDLPVVIETYGPQGSYLAASVVCHTSAQEETESLLKEAGFMSFHLPQQSGTVKQYIEKTEQEKSEFNQKAAELTERAKQLGAETRKLKLLYDGRSTVRNRYAAPVAATESTFYITGWVVEERQSEIEQAVSAVTDIYEIEITDPAEGEQPPTLVRNISCVTPFETLTDMFSRPNPIEKIDPNPAMAPWYWIIFGMMMADAGYGLLMAIIFTVYIKLKKPRGESGKLVRVLQFASITTAFWGVLFGSYFGEQLLPAVLFVPLENPIPMLVMSFAIGALHIFCGLIINAIQLIKQGKVGEAIGCNFGWIVMITGLPLMLLTGFGKWIALAGLAMIIIFTKSGEKNPFKRVMGGISSLTGITNYMSDILSYSRIVALMLASGVVAMVMNILAGMVAGMMPVVGFILSLLVYAVGHAFNLVMGLLSAYVHSSRLQYIEFYGKFYEGGGYEFTPLSYSSTYNVIKQNNK